METAGVADGPANDGDISLNRGEVCSCASSHRILPSLAPTDAAFPVAATRLWLRLSVFNLFLNSVFSHPSLGRVLRPDRSLEPEVITFLGGLPGGAAQPG